MSVPVNFNIACLTDPPSLCLLKKTFVFDYVLPPDSTAYTFVYQRCCRNSAVMNIQNPGAEGSTYYCQIPPVQVTPHNNSAVFTNYPPQVICVGDELVYDNSATDADGDSLSYELCGAYNAPNGVERNVVPQAPPFDPVIYVSPPYSYSNPINGSPALSIDPVSGVIRCTPTLAGRFLVTVCCNEWRHGVMINTIHREFQFVVTHCSRTVVAAMPYFTNDVQIYEIDCKDHTINFINNSTGATSWHWDFGLPSVLTDTSALFQPSFVYPDSGTYMVKLVANPGTQCADSIQKLVKLYPFFSTAFTDSGRFCPGDSVYFRDLSYGTADQVTAWAWRFGDGDTSMRQNPVHIFPFGSTFDVTLVSSNVKGCTDTAIHQLPVETFKPFAGNDTIIVKGSGIQLNATGGVQYTWSPAENLFNVNSASPNGFYPDTGLYTYIVSVVSAYGCHGNDTVNVWVVGQSSFYVPTAFSPNGDGLNDIFRPQAVGYRSMNSFRIFNRWGQEVYYSATLDAGWDGTFAGQQAEMGTYYWQISYTDRYGNTASRKGDVTLVR